MAKSSKVTVPALLGKKKRNKKIVMTTAYDSTMARLIDSCDVDVALVGDSLGMVCQGHQNTVRVTLDHMVYHCAAVARVVNKVHVCADMPFLSNKKSVDDTVLDAARLIQEGGAESVKIEGGVPMHRRIEAIVESGIPVVGHVGMTPQSVHALGGFKQQGKTSVTARRIIDDAKSVQDAGAFMVVLEGVPADLAGQITDTLTIPTIGIYAGPRCDGQVLVSTDLLGMDAEFKPRFAKRYAELAGACKDAFNAYAREVRSDAFPDEAHTPGAKKG